LIIKPSIPTAKTLIKKVIAYFLVDLFSCRFDTNGYLTTGTAVLVSLNLVQNLKKEQMQDCRVSRQRSFTWRNAYQGNNKDGIPG